MKDSGIWISFVFSSLTRLSSLCEVFLGGEKLSSQLSLFVFCQFRFVGFQDVVFWFHLGTVLTLSLFGFL